MKLSKLKQQLIEKNQNRVSSINYNFKNQEKESSNKLSTNQVINQKDAGVYRPSDELPSIFELTPLEEGNSSFDLDGVKIIGITGSKGKSTTAFIVHEYIKSLGFKSVLYSSIKIESLASYVDPNEPCEIALKDENVLLNVIEEAQAYEADYIVLEINESTIEKGFTKGVPFKVRALTNIMSDHNKIHYSIDEYINLKKSFFKDIPSDEDCTCVYGLTGTLKREEFNELLKLNNHPKKTFGSKYICEVRNADYTTIDYLLYSPNNIPQDTLDGLNMRVRVKDQSYDFHTSVILPYNALNFVCAIAILDALTIFEASKFNHVIANIQIPGRDEVIKVNGRTIIVGLSLVPAVEIFKKYKQQGIINQVKVVVASRGLGYQNWEDRYIRDQVPNERNNARRYAMNYLKKHADYVYLTSSDNAAESPLEIANEMKRYLNDEIPSVIETDRKQAIKKAILESNEGDLIYIAGRGNRRIFCDSATTIKLIQDKEVVLEVLHELGWK